MLHIKSISDRRLFLLIWAFSITLGWTIIIYPGFVLRNEVLSSWKMLLPISLNLLASSLLLGGMIGLMQYLFCRPDNVLSWRWIVVSAISYGLGITSSFLILTATFGMIYPSVFSSAGASFLIMPSELVMLFGGGVTALVQAIALKGILFHSYKEVFVWALAMALIWELGLFLASFLTQTNTPLFLQSGLAGLVIGLGTAFLMNMQVNQLSKPGITS